MKRTLLLGSAWTAAAGAAVGLGFLAVSLVDASAAPGSQPVAASSTPSGTPDVSPSASSSAAATPTPTDLPPAVPDGQHVTDGGSVYASCADGVPVLASAPFPDWWLDDSNDPGKVEFQNGTLEIEVRVACVAGTPQFSVEGPHAEDSSGRTSSTPAPAATTVSGDDRGGDHGGHGSDDPPGDDHGGDRGGHGSDD